MSLMRPILTGQDRQNVGEGCLENPCVGGSIPPQATKKIEKAHYHSDSALFSWPSAVMMTLRRCTKSGNAPNAPVVIRAATKVVNSNWQRISLKRVDFPLCLF